MARSKLDVVDLILTLREVRRRLQDAHGAGIRDVNRIQAARRIIHDTLAAVDLIDQCNGVDNRKVEKES